VIILDRFIAYYFSLGSVNWQFSLCPMGLASYGMFPSEPVFVIVGGVSPTIAALIVAKLEFGRGGAEYLFGQFGRRGFQNYVF